MTELIKYEAACRALAACKSFDEVKSWVDKAAAMKAYSRMAKDKTMEVDAAEIRIRAERRLGQMLSEQKAGDGLAKPGVKPTTNSVADNDRIPKLSEVGITKDLSSRAQRLAAVPEQTFEAELAAKRERDKQDGARVSARLEAAGEKVLREAGNQSEDFGPSAEEIFESEQSVKHDMERMRLVLDTDAPLAEMTEKCKQLQAQLTKLEWRMRGLVNENAALTKQLVKWKNRCEKMEKAAA